MNSTDILCQFQFKGTCPCRQVQNVVGSLHTCSEPAGLHQQGLEARETQQYRPNRPEAMSSSYVTEERIKSGGSTRRRGGVYAYPHPQVPCRVWGNFYRTSWLRGLQLSQNFRPSAPELTPKFFLPRTFKSRSPLCSRLPHSTYCTQCPTAVVQESLGLFSIFRATQLSPTLLLQFVLTMNHPLGGFFLYLPDPSLFTENLMYLPFTSMILELSHRITLNVVMNSLC